MMLSHWFGRGAIAAPVDPRLYALVTKVSLALISAALAAAIVAIVQLCRKSIDLARFGSQEMTYVISAASSSTVLWGIRPRWLPLWLPLGLGCLLIVVGVAEMQLAQKARRAKAERHAALDEWRVPETQRREWLARLEERKARGGRPMKRGQ